MINHARDIEAILEGRPVRVQWLPFCETEYLIWYKEYSMDTTWSYANRYKEAFRKKVDKFIKEVDEHYGKI